MGDQVTPITDKANASLDSPGKKAESSHDKVIRISDRTPSSVQRLIASLEKQAETGWRPVGPDPGASPIGPEGQPGPTRPTSDASSVTFIGRGPI
jgi:hypothetical protein